MRCVAKRRLVWMLAAWIGLLGAPLSAFALERGCQTPFAMNADAVMAELSIDGMGPDRRGNHENQAILDDRDAIDHKTALTAGLENPQAPDAVGDISHLFGVSIDRSVFHSVSLVEPHFLRYGRLLN